MCAESDCSSNKRSHLQIIQWFGATALLGLVLIGAIGCGNNDTPGQKACSNHSECDLGSVCGSEGTCVETKCSFCASDDELICYETEANPQGTCSKPECSANSECPEPGESCIDGQCQGNECSSDDDCPGDEVCGAFGACTEGGTTGGTGDAGGDAGIDGGSGSGTGGDSGIDDGGGMPDGGSGTTGGDTGGDPCGGCPSGKACNPNTGMCEDSNCGMPKDCSNKPQANIWSDLYCACVECKGDSDCSGDNVCRGGTCAPPCGTKCTGGDSSKCGTDKPYCISECCVECIGTMDCEGDKVCVDGTCSKGATNNCTSGSCPTGYSCNSSTGKCEQQTSGMSCSSQDPTSCPQGEFCDPQTQMCTNPTGGMGGQCGLCGNNCSCPGKLTCQQFICTGCSQQLFGGDPDYKCPSGQTCLPLGSLMGPDPGNICFSAM